MHTRNLLAAALLATAMLDANAAYVDGNQLLSNLASPQTKGYGSAYVMGIVDAEAYAKGFTGHKKLLRTCYDVPDQVTSGQLGDIVRLWLDRNPQHRHFGASNLVAAALGEAYPCKP